MDITRIHGKQLKALIDGHRDGLFKEYNLAKPIKQCLGFKPVPSPSSEEGEFGDDVSEVFRLTLDERERVRQIYGNGIPRERLELSLNDANWTPFYLPKNQRNPDDGLGWAKSVRKEVREWTARAQTEHGAGEKVEIQMGDFLWLQATLRPPILDEFDKQSLIKVHGPYNPPSPILLPREAPPSPFQPKAIRTIKGTFSPLPENSPRDTAEALTSELLQEDGDYFQNFQCPIGMENEAITNQMIDLEPYRDLKLEVPLSQRFPALDVLQNHHRGNGHTRSDIVHRPPPNYPPLDKFPPSDDDQTWFLQLVNSRANQFNDILLQEQLQDDDHLRVEIPRLDSPRNDVIDTWDQIAVQLKLKGLTGPAGKEFLGVRTLSLELVDLRRWMSQKGYKTLPPERIEGWESVDNDVMLMKTEALRSEADLIASSKWAKLSWDVDEEPLEHRLPHDNTSNAAITQEKPGNLPPGTEAPTTSNIDITFLADNGENGSRSSLGKRKAELLDSLPDRKRVVRTESSDDLQYFNSGKYKLLRGNQVFSAQGSLDTFMSLRKVETGIPLRPVVNSTFSPHFSSPMSSGIQAQVREATPSKLPTTLEKNKDTNQTALLAIGNNSSFHTVQTPFPTLPEFLFKPLPTNAKSAGLMVGTCFCLVSVALLSYRQLFKAMVQMCPPQLRFIERDFEGHNTQPDILVSCTVGILITTMEHIRQPVLLPGERAIPGLSEVRKRITSCVGKLDRLWIIVTYSNSTMESNLLSNMGMSQRDGRAWSEFSEWAKGTTNAKRMERDIYSRMLRSEIHPLLIPVPQNTTNEFKEVASIVTNIILHEKAREEPIPELLVDELDVQDLETEDEIIMRLPPLNMNAYAAYIFAKVLNLKYNVGFPLGTLAREFVEMDHEDREALFGSIMGGFYAE
ncbi:hypothetical protein DFH27DRAFT_639967 [Peziza echinospora]|nr:hypothetical protein DFH27DRAFT_639967 [Peziza echinospora]